jgi:hypothetical protein
MVKVELDYTRARPVLGNLIGYTIGRWAGREIQVRRGRSLAKEYGGLVLTIVGGAAQLVTDYPYEDDVRKVASGLAMAGLDDLIRVRVYDEPIAWFTDSNTLVVRNLKEFSETASNWTVKVDGSNVTVSDVEGDEKEAVLSLASAVSKGAHEVIIMVAGGSRAFYGKLVVP